MPTPVVTDGNLQITLTLHEKDGPYVGERGNPNFASVTFVKQCTTGSGGKTTAVTTCLFKTPRQIAQETRARQTKGTH